MTCKRLCPVHASLSRRTNKRPTSVGGSIQTLTIKRRGLPFGLIAPLLFDCEAKPGWLRRRHLEHLLNHDSPVRQPDKELRANHTRLFAKRWRRCLLLTHPRVALFKSAPLTGAGEGRIHFISVKCRLDLQIVAA